MRKKTHAEFAEQIKKRPFDVVGIYNGSHYPLEFICNVCGNTWFNRPSNILNGQGCPPCAYKIISNKQRKSNNIKKDHGDYLEIDISTQKYPEAIMLIDNIDWNYLKRMGIGRISADQCGYTKYAVVWMDKRKYKVHRLLLPESICVDHKDHNGLNNRMSNIRSCTKAQNNWNSGKRSGNTSGFKGVTQNKNSGKWVSSIFVNGLGIHLGTFKNPKDASEAYEAAAMKYHGNFFNDNN